jgi:hypothetical protein
MPVSCKHGFINGVRGGSGAAQPSMLFLTNGVLSMAGAAAAGSLLAAVVTEIDLCSACSTQDIDIEAPRPHPGGTFLVATIFIDGVSTAAADPANNITEAQCHLRHTPIRLGALH